MTFEEMVMRTRELLDKTEDSDELDGQIKHALNVAYMTVARDKWRPTTSELMKPDLKTGCVPIKNLSECFVSLKTVRRYGGMRLRAWAGKDFIHISPPFIQVAVEYYYLPHPLENPDDTPIIPSAQVDPYAYIYFAAAQCLNIKHMHSEAAVWEKKYKDIADNIHEVRGNIIIPDERW